jgi:hypothetical protein
LGAIEERKEWTPESEESVAPVENTEESKTEDKSILGSILNKLKG